MPLLLPNLVAAEETYIAGVTAKASSTQVEGLFGPANLVNDHGFSRQKGKANQWNLTTNGYADGGSMWHSGYLATGADENPLVEFDLGKTYTLGAFHLWNYNGSPHRGISHATLTYSVDGKAWQTIANPYHFAKAPKSDDYLGERLAFSRPITARWIRFFGHGTHRGQGQPDVAGLGKVRFLPATAAEIAAGKKLKPLPASPYPADSGWANVQGSPYFAKGDGKTDDTAAIQTAIDDCQGTGRTIFLPAGTYLISKTLKFTPGKGHGRNNLRGAGETKTILRLADGTFADTKQPQPLLTLGFFGSEASQKGSADWFHNNVADLSLETGDNAGAIGLQFYSNNTGSLRNVTIRAQHASSPIGLDLGYFDMNGPLLVKRVTVEGFAIGVRTGGTVNSQTFEHLTLKNQTQFGFLNEGQCLAIRGLVSHNQVPAFKSSFGVVALIDCQLTGLGDAKNQSAIITHEALFARNITTSGYKLAIENKAEKETPSVAGPNVSEFVSSPVLSLFPGSGKSLNLPIEETPEPPLPALDSAQWVNARDLREVTQPNDTIALQAALSGKKSHVYLPKGSVYRVTANLVVSPQIERISGMHGQLIGHAEKDQPAPVLRIEGESTKPLVIEDCWLGLVLENVAQRPLVILNCEASGKLMGKGKVFLENVVGLWEIGPQQQFWARHFNTEDQGIHFTNRGGTAWFLGLKTERGGPLVQATADSRTEVLGGLSYTTTEGKLGPMFVCDESQMSVTLGEVCYTGDPYALLVRETHSGQTKELPRGSAPLRPSFLQGSRLPLFVSGAGEK